MSTFDPQALLANSTAQANDTQVTPVPQGNWTAILSLGEPKQQPKRGEEDVMVTFIPLIYTIQDDEVKEETGRAEPTVRDTLWLDIADDGTLDMGKGKNTGLGKLREACGMNQPGVEFSLGMLNGQAVVIDVFHKPKDDDPSVIYTNIRSVAAL